MTFSPVDPTGAPSGRRAAVVIILAGLLLGLHALLAWWLRAPAITTGHDDAVYLLLARSLRHFSYHDAWLVGTPPEAQYPPLYPAVLALVGAVLGDGLDTALALNVLLSTFALGVFFALVRRWSPGVALLGLAVCAVNPWLIRLAGLVASEPLFLVLVALTLWLLAVQPATGRSRIAATATAVAAMLTRLIGVTLAIALVGQWLIERRFRAVAAFGGASALLGGAWLVWTAMAPRGLPGQSYIADAFFREPAVSVSGPDSGAAGPRAPAARAEPRALLPTLVTRIGRNVRAYAQTGIPSALALPTVKKTAWDNLFWLLVLLGFGVLGLRELWRNLPAGVLLLGSYTLVLLLWPYSIERYFVPVVPLAVLTILLGSRRI
ncbi:MAG TPA: hypothetical protein VGQ73_00215, partial [Gemmatimonadales bacterium]|nr:hypothetical protein [Gemmatimonadales bacterium]